MEQQTAVEWLINELGEYFPDYIGGIELLVKQAKAMEKEQIENGYLSGMFHSLQMEATKQAEQYYNETYNK